MRRHGMRRHGMRKNGKKGRWYISGAVSDNPCYRADFEFAERWLVSAGYRVLNPVKGEKDGKPWDYYLRKDIRKLLRCDGIVMLSGWERSRGARLEHAVALALGYAVKYIDLLTGEIKDYE